MNLKRIVFATALVGLLAGCGEATDKASQQPSSPEQTAEQKNTMPGHAENDQIAIHQGWVRAVPPVSKNSAAYFMLQNKTGQADTIVSLTADVAAVTEFHEIITETSGAKRMQQVLDPTVNANSTMALKPGSYHVMLIDLKQPLKEGGEVQLELAFKNAGKIRVTLPVKASDEGEEMNHGGMHH